MRPLITCLFLSCFSTGVMAESACQQPQTFPPTPQSISNFNKSVMESLFSFKHQQLDTQQQALESCFSKAGWKSYQTALKTSGNMEAINNLKLDATATLNHQSIEKESSDQWRIVNNITVDYVNSTHTGKQTLEVTALVRADEKRLGIVQILAKDTTDNHTDS